MIALVSVTSNVSFLYLKMQILSLAGHPSVRWIVIQIMLFCSLKIWIFVDHRGTQVRTMWVTYLTDSCYECFKQHCELLAAVSYQEEINCGFIKCWSQFHPWFYWTDFNETMPRTHSLSWVALSHLLHWTYCTDITKAYKARGKNHLLVSSILS